MPRKPMIPPTTKSPEQVTKAILRKPMVLTQSSSKRSSPANAWSPLGRPMVHVEVGSSEKRRHTKMQFPRECEGLLSLVVALAGPLRRFAPAPPEGELFQITTYALVSARG